MFASIRTMATSGVFTVLDGAEKVRETANKGRRSEEMFSSKLGRSFKAATTAFRAEWNSTTNTVAQAVQDATDEVAHAVVMTAVVADVTARKGGSAAKRTARRARAAARKHITARNAARVVVSLVKHGYVDYRTAQARRQMEELGLTFDRSLARGLIGGTFVGMVRNNAQQAMGL